MPTLSSCSYEYEATVMQPHASKRSGEEVKHNEPDIVSLCAQAPINKLWLPLPLDFDHKKDFEIPTKHKEAIR
jgi:hypothetical protein